MTALILLRPLWLLALVPIGLAAVLAWRRQAAGGWESVIAPGMLAHLRSFGYLAPPGARWPVLLPFAVATIVVLALSGPARLRDDGASFDRLDPIILLLDMSASVTGGANLADAQAAAAQLLQEAGGRPVGVVLYTSDAYVASAPTADTESLQGLVAVLDDQTMPVGGSRPDIALAEAAQIFATEARPGIAGADIVLISDGGGAGPRAEEEAALLRSRGARVWALGLTHADGPPASPGPAPDDLARVAEAGGGAYAPAREPRPLLMRIATARTEALAQSPKAAEVFEDLGRWLLLLALPAALMLFRREMGAR